MPFVMTTVFHWIMIPGSSGDKSCLAGRPHAGLMMNDGGQSAKEESRGVDTHGNK